MDLIVLMKTAFFKRTAYRLEVEADVLLLNPSYTEGVQRIVLNKNKT